MSLVKNGFEGIAHFMNHPEMLPYVGDEVLFVGECVNLPDNSFVDKADAFKNWYTEPTPKIVDGISEEDWRMARAHFDVRLTVARNYDKYARPTSRLLNEVAELYAETADKTLRRNLNERHMYSCYSYDMQRMDICYAMGYLDRDLDQDARRRFRACSYCTYFQRPNLTAGEFQEIMPDEDKYSFEIFCRVLEVIKPSLVLVLSAKASESIKRRLVGKLPYKILLFNSANPNEWDKDELRNFKKAVRAIFKKHVEFHLKSWLRATGQEDEYFTSAIDNVLLGRQFENRKSLKALDKMIATNAVELIAQNPSGNEKAWFNCYPLEVGATKTFPLFLAVCRGEEQLETVFDKMLEQAQKIVAVYPEGKLVKRNIVLLTDKWDKDIFKSYESKFLEYKDLIHFVFGFIKRSVHIAILSQTPANVKHFCLTVCTRRSPSKRRRPARSCESSPNPC